MSVMVVSKQVFGTQAGRLTTFAIFISVLVIVVNSLGSQQAVQPTPQPSRSGAPLPRTAQPSQAPVSALAWQQKTGAQPSSSTVHGLLNSLFARGPKSGVPSSQSTASAAYAQPISCSGIKGRLVPRLGNQHCGVTTAAYVPAPAPPSPTPLADIGGTWVGASGRYFYAMDLTQSGTQVEGTFYVAQDSQAERTTIRLEGKVQGDRLQLHGQEFLSRSSSVRSCLAFLDLQKPNNEMRLIGKWEPPHSNVSNPCPGTGGLSFRKGPIPTLVTQQPPPDDPAKTLKELLEVLDSTKTSETSPELPDPPARSEVVKITKAPNFRAGDRSVGRNDVKLTLWANSGGEAPISSFPVNPRKDGSFSTILADKTDLGRKLFRQLTKWKFSGNLPMPETGEARVILEYRTQKSCDVQFLFQGKEVKPFAGEFASQKDVAILTVPSAQKGELRSFSVWFQCRSHSAGNYGSYFAISVSYPNSSNSYLISDYRPL